MITRTFVMHLILSKFSSQIEAVHRTDNHVEKNRAWVMDNVFLLTG